MEVDFSVTILSKMADLVKSWTEEDLKSLGICDICFKAIKEYGIFSAPLFVLPYSCECGKKIKKKRK